MGGRKTSQRPSAPAFADADFPPNSTRTSAPESAPPQIFTRSPRCKTILSENIFGIFISANAAGASAAAARKTANFFMAIKITGGGAPATPRNAMPIPRFFKI